MTTLDAAQAALDAAHDEARAAFEAWDALLWTPGASGEALNSACQRWYDALAAQRACEAQLDGCAAGAQS